VFKNVPEYIHLVSTIAHRQASAANSPNASLRRHAGARERAGAVLLGDAYPLAGVAIRKPGEGMEVMIVNSYREHLN